MLQLKNAIRSQCSSIVSSRPSNRNQKWKKESTFLKVHRKRKVRLLSVLGIQKLICQESFLQLKVSWLKFSSFLPEFNYFLTLLFYGQIKDDEGFLTFFFYVPSLFTFCKGKFFHVSLFCQPCKNMYTLWTNHISHAIRPHIKEVFGTNAPILR